MLSSALICAIVPVIVTELVPLPETPAPLVPAVTVSMPWRDRQGHRLAAAIAVDIADREAGILEVERGVARCAE